jgi:hypothetical protein
LSKYITVLAVFAIFIAGAAMAQTSPNPQNDDSSQGLVIPRQTFGNDVVCREQPLQYFRPTNQCGINMFETPKENSVPFDKFKIDWGAAFTQNFQSLKHSNATEPPIELAHIGWGFPRASANLYLHAQLAPGIRLQLSTYLSSRHHQDTWVKDGYVQMDQSPIDLGMLNALWERLITIKVGHMEINYGDAHFRRSDNGMGMYNPFVENYLLDAFTTEIGAEGYFRLNSVMLMGAITGGELNGNVQDSQYRNLAYIWKVAYDKQVNPDLRVRMSFSNYIDNKSAANSLYRGDRAGSFYWGPLEAEPLDVASSAFSGRINPDFRNKVRAYQFNPFIKYKGLELFGVIEHALGLRFPETEHRTWNQYAADAVYRFGADKFFAGVRYNYAEGQLRGIPGRVNVNRTQVGAGWFPLPYLLMKAEFVNQNHNDYPVDDIDYGGNFHGVTISSVLAF